MENNMVDGMVMTTLETFDCEDLGEEFNRARLESLDRVEENDDNVEFGGNQSVRGSCSVVESDELMMRNNMLWDIPAFNDASHWMDNMDIDDHMRYDTRFNGGSIGHGSLFVSKEKLIYACQKYSILNRVEYYTYKSDKNRLILFCREGKDKCEWHVRASLKKKSVMWEINKFGGAHTCENDITPKDNVHFSKFFIAQEIIDILEENLRLTPKAIRKLMHRKYGYNIPYVKAWKARQKALEYLFGNWRESFAQLPILMNAIMEYNPGSSWFMKTTTLASGDVSVDRIFWAFYPAIKAFESCRPVLCIDGTHLYGKYKGVLLLAVSLDANNHVVPLCYALVENESNDTWSWFMRCIRAGFTQRDELCVISDRHPGIMNVMKEPDWSPPRAYHRVCARHFVSNFNTRVKSKSLKSILLRLAYLPQKKKFKSMFVDLKKALKVDIGSIEWLDAIPREKWAFAYDNDGRRWGSMTTNASECFNNVIMGGRDLPITALVNYTLRQANDYFTRRRALYCDLIGRYAPNVEKMINCLREKSVRHEVEMYDRENIVAKVITHAKRNIHIVDFRARTCTCGKWELYHYPCSHVLAVCTHEHLSISGCVAPEYGLSVYRETWSHTFNPLPDPAYWPTYEGPKHVPNEMYKRNKRGRPPSRRRPNEMDGRIRDTGCSQGTSSQGTSTQKETRVQKCSLCRELGHNKKSCRSGETNE